MRRRPPSSSSDGQTGSPSADVERSQGKIDAERSAVLCFTMFVLFLYGSWEFYRFQYHRLPAPLTASQAGKRGFSEELAMKHVKALTGFGPRPVGSDSLDRAVQYVLEASENIKRTAHWEVDVEVDLFHSKSGVNLLVGGMFKGKTLIYSNMKHVVVRILPKYLPEAEENTILVSSHIDTVFSTEGAGDCSSCVGVMLELARGVSHWAHGFKGGIIFLFNTGEEEGLNGAHSFITQHPWRHAVRFFVDLEAIGVGGKSSIFQSGSAFWPLETFARVAKYPSAQVVSQDLFLSGAIKSATDFQVYEEVGGLPGLDFAYTDLSAVYHTKNDKLKFLKPGSLQHLGENMLPFLIQSAMSSDLSKGGAVQDKDQDRPVFFDILGTYMVAYRQSSASVVQKTVILQALLLWSGSLFVGGYQAIIATGLSFLGIILMWIFSLILSILVVFLLPLVCEHPAPYISNPWLIIGLFGAPAVVGALVGQHLGFHILHNYLCYVSSKRQPLSAKHVDILKLESERWLFKAGFLQWLTVLVLGSYFKAGSSYIALIWLISPAFFCKFSIFIGLLQIASIIRIFFCLDGLMEATLTPARTPRKLKIITLLFGLTVPILISAGGFIRLGEFIAGSTVRFDRNPGTTPVWLGNLIVAIFVVTVVCLLFVYLLSYFHLSVFRGKSLVIISMCFVFFLSLAGVSFGVLPAFSNDVARAVNVVHVVDASGSYEENLDPVSFVTIFSTTPGKLGREMDILKDEDFSCGTNHVVDFVTFSVNHSCWSLDESTNGWSKLDIPILKVEHDKIAEVRKTHVLIDTKSSTRWSLAINSDQVESFSLEASCDDLLSVDLKTEGEGWHIIQFSGGKDSPTKFMLTLSWKRNETRSSKGTINPEKSQPLLKLRTDLSTITPKTARVLEKLPSWCSLFGKSTFPHTLAFLTSLPLEF